MTDAKIMDPAEHLPATTPRAWRLVGGVSVTAMVLLAMGCLGLQLVTQQALHVAIVVVLNTLNAVVVFAFGYQVAPYLGALLGDFPPDRPVPSTGQSIVPSTGPSTGQPPSTPRDAPTGPNPLQAGVDRIMGRGSSVLFGLLYASVVSGVVWLTNPFEVEAPFSWLLPAILFCGNVVHGTAFACVLRYWGVFRANLAGFDLRLLDLSRPLPVRLITLNSRVVAVVAFVSSTSLVALMVATMDQNTQVLGYSVFVLLLVAASYAIPTVPLSNRLHMLKAVELSRADRLIEAHARRLLQQPRRPDGPAEEAELPPLEELLELRARIARVQTLPPGGQVSVSATAIVTFFSFLPALVDFALNRFS